MRKLVALSVAAFFALTVAALAGGSADRTIVGTVSHVDASAKTLTIKDSSGSDVTISWNDTTKLSSGMPQEGSTVSVVVDGKDQGSTPLAKSIAVQSKKPY